MTRFSSGWLGVLARATMVVATAFVAACGSGAVSAPPTPAAIEPISVSPPTATVYADLPSTFLLSGGNGTFVVTSSDQAAVPISGTFTSNQLTVVPNPVAVDTPVTLTVRDTGTSAPVNVTLTVKPRTISNVLTITPSSSQSASCGTALCAGGDAEVRATLSLNGLPLRAKPVRFEVLSGDLRFISGGTGASETLVTSFTTTTDDAGVALARIRASTTAGAQTALLQVSDVSSGFVQRASVTIAPIGSSPLAATPATLTFQGTTPGTCASNVSADVIVTGGKPPYQTSQPTNFLIAPSRVDASGGRFTVSPTGQCTAGTQIAIVDSAGASVTINATNTLSSATATAFTVAPTAVSLNSCGDSANVALIGGTGNYIATSGNAAVEATASANGGVIKRAQNGFPGTGSVVVSFSDGKTTQSVTVTLTGGALGICPPPATPGLSVSPQKVDISSCTSSPTVIISGGNGRYSAVASNISLETVVTNNVLTVRRKRPSDAIVGSNPCPTGAPAGNQCVTVSDGSLTAFVGVNVIETGTCAPAP